MARYVVENPNRIIQFFLESEQEVMDVVKEAILSIPEAMNCAENRMDLGQMIEMSIPDHFNKERDPEHYFLHTPGEGLDLTYYEGDYTCKVSVKSQKSIFSREMRNGAGGRTAPMKIKIKNSLGEHNDLIRNFDYLLAIQKEKERYGFGVTDFASVDRKKVPEKDGVSVKLLDEDWLLLSRVSAIQRRECPSPAELNDVYYAYKKEMREALRECVTKNCNFSTKTVLREHAA